MKYQIVSSSLRHAAYVLTVGFTFLCLASSANAVTLINETWESYTAGQSPASPWQNSYGGGTSPAASVNTIVNQSINGPASNWALIGNNATNEPISNPGLVRTFTAQPASSFLNISFSFMIPANYGNSSQEFFTLAYTNGTTATVGIQLYLGPNYQGGSSSLGYRTSGGARVNLGGSFVAGSTVNVSITNASRQNGTYDIAWTGSAGITPGSASGIAVTGSTGANDWNMISFGESSNTSSTSLIYVDNIVVGAVPEPTTAGLVAIAGGVALFGIAKRRRSAIRTN